MSYLAWIDFDPEERRRAQTLIDLFKQPEARDELGLGTVRDGLADILFPGTSTIQTRLRYMLFISWIYREAQQRKGSQAERTAFARNREFELAEALLAGGEKVGVIGRDAGRNLKRLASSVYWAGLHALGIRTTPGAPTMFLSYGPDDLKDHDLSFWAPRFPDPPADLFRTTDFALLPEETAFLRGRLAVNAKASLLNELALKQKCFDEEWPWQVSENTVSESSRAILRHAERFSAVMYGASLFYNLLLALRAAERPNAKVYADAPELIEGYRSRLRDWWAELDHLALDEWVVDDLFRIVGTTSHNPTSGTRDFIRNWVDIAREGQAALENSARAVDLIRRREGGLKPKKARLSFEAPLERWSGASGVARFDFRWRITRSYLGDLAGGC
jgi:hypothetical protein